MRVLPAREWRQHRPLAPELSSSGPPASRHCVSQRRTQGCRPRRHSRGRGGREEGHNTTTWTQTTSVDVANHKSQEAEGGAHFFSHRPMLASTQFSLDVDGQTPGFAALSHYQITAAALGGHLARLDPWAPAWAAWTGKHPEIERHLGLLACLHITLHFTHHFDL